MTATPPPGWYPDPGGSASQRWWDGRAWTPRLQPAGTPTGPGPDPGSPEPGGRRGLVLVLVIAAVVVAVVIGLWQLPGLFGRPTPAPGPLPTTTPTVQGWDENPTATPSFQPSTPPPSEWTPPEWPAGGCPAQPDRTLPAPVPPPMKVGALTITPPRGWVGPTSDVRIPAARDAWMYYTPAAEVSDSWASSLTVGFTAPEGEVRSLEEEATDLLTCIVAGGPYGGAQATLEQAELSLAAVPGAGGVRIDATATIGAPDLDTRASVIVLIVVDTDQGRQFVFGATPEENAAHREALLAAVDTLTTL